MKFQLKLKLFLLNSMLIGSFMYGAQPTPVEDKKLQEAVLSQDNFTKVTKEGCLHFMAIKKVGDYLFDLIEKNKGPEKISFAEDFRKQGPNPFYSQTKQGLLLEFYYGHPSRLWTPWGQVHLVGSSGGRGDAWREVNPEFLKHIWSKNAPRRKI